MPRARNPKRGPAPDPDQRFYFGRQGLRLAGAIFVFLGVLALGVAPFMLGRLQGLLSGLLAIWGLANLILAAGLWWLRPWSLRAFAAWAVAAVAFQIGYQASVHFLSWGVFAMTETGFAVVLAQIGRYLKHDLAALRVL